MPVWCNAALEVCSTSEFSDWPLQWRHYVCRRDPFTPRCSVISTKNGFLHHVSVETSNLQVKCDVFKPSTPWLCESFERFPAKCQKMLKIVCWPNEKSTSRKPIRLRTERSEWSVNVDTRTVHSCWARQYGKQTVVVLPVETRRLKGWRVEGSGPCGLCSCSRIENDAV